MLPEFNVFPYALRVARIHVTFTARADTQFDGWIGATLRNNLLYASRQVVCQLAGGSGSLYDKLMQLPIPRSHPVYEQLKGGFPKGYTVRFDAPPDYSPQLTLKAGETLSFSVSLIGQMISSISDFETALYRMADRGIGIGRKPFDCSLYVEPSVGIFPDNAIEGRYLRIQFITPVSLPFKRNVVEDALSYQDKMNGFPSLYQIVKTACYRISTLALLYGEDSGIDEDGGIYSLLDVAKEAILEQSYLRRVLLRGAPKKEVSSRAFFEGYVGTLTFREVSPSLFRLLVAASQVGIGSETSYGLGSFEVKSAGRVKKE